MKARAQHGTIDNAPVLWIVVILVAVGFFSYPGERTAPAYAVFALVEAGLLGALWATGGLPWLDSAMRGSIARKVAGSLGAEVRAEEQRIWGGDTAMAYAVPWRRGGRDVTLALDVSGTIATLHVPGGKGTPLSLATFDSGEPVLSAGAGTPAAASFLDERVRTNLGCIEHIGRRRALSVSVGADGVTIYKHAHFGARKTLLFLNLCWPVFDRALETCFGVRVDPPSKVCATCGGECCPTCDGAHQPGCGCA